MDLLKDLSSGANGQEVPHICARRELNSFAPLRPNVLHCYGVDFLSTKEVLELFVQWEPKEVEWLDDSSCNVVFGLQEHAKQALTQLAASEQPGEAWTVTNPLSINNKVKQSKGKASFREFCLELRFATEADQKDVSHSGHSDSVYYAHVKEQQALRKQQAELRQLKKRQRFSNFLGARKESLQQTHEVNGLGEGHSPSSSSTATATTAQPAAKASDSSKPSLLPSSTAVEPAVPRIGFRGLLDPLLFLRAPTSGNDDATNGKTLAPDQRKTDDLRTALKKAEAEYASVLQPISQPKAAKDTSKGKGRGKGRFSGKEAGTNEKMNADRGNPVDPSSLRGKKRRPLEQEPRPVTEAPPQKRMVQALPEVEAFLKQHGVRCRRYPLHRTFRAIVYGQQQAKKSQGLTKPKADQLNAPKDNSHEAETKEGANEMQVDQHPKELPPWEQYLRVNNFFAQNGHFMHTVSWEADDCCILAIVPHPLRIDVEKLAKAVQKPVGSIQQRKLKDIAKDTGFPVFVCPPFGHPKDEKGRATITLIDSSVTELKRPLLFDCGSTGLCLPVSEFLRSTGAACVEGLAKAAPGGTEVPEKMQH